ncbi:MAG: hypothetical protein R3290_09015 [Acidimicrobiia bacterium]|nr:hypothetical protein [Acidimicrobiia bacterium]
MRHLIAVLGLVLVAAACAEGTDPSSGSGSATVASMPTPSAPDFTLALDDGGVFRLADEQKPVYLVFWAEW